jgi:Amt family ammonium transporter
MLLLAGTVLVVCCQMGFFQLESGFVHVKNTGSILIKNLVNLCITYLAFMFLGFGVMFGRGNGFFGWLDPFSLGDYASVLPAGVPSDMFVIYYGACCASVGSIAAGAMSGRNRFAAHCAICFFIALFVYPVVGRWTADGWLSQLGFEDFCGAGAIHLTAGVASAVGAGYIGPRLGKYSEDGKPKAMPGHSVAQSGAGTFILWACWFGFAAGAVAAMPGDEAPKLFAKLFFNLNIAAAASACAALTFIWIRYPKPDISMTMNGLLAGLVGVSSGAASVNALGAAAIGVCCGLCSVAAIEFIETRARIDDPCGAISVHGVCALLGILLTGVFSAENGLFYGRGAARIGVQFLGAAAVSVWVAFTMTAVLFVLNKYVGLRVAPRDEINGLDAAEHGLAMLYAEAMADSLIDYQGEGKNQTGNPSNKIPELKKPSSVRKITKVEILMRQTRFESLKEAMNEIGVTGVTVTQALGCGMQKGNREYYRGIEREMTLLPKIRVEIVVTKVPASLVIDTARKVLYTGHIGDGKIFVYDVEDVIKVRTGETGYDALQGVDE